MNSDKSVGERLGDAGDKLKNTASNAGKAVQDKSREAGHRTNANEHDAKAESSDNMLGKAEHSLKGSAGRGKAEVEDGKSEYHLEKAENVAKK